ncbi:MAG: septal ring lytic transglycosylase RlpA family protein [Bradyrhizobium sp.]|nr:MAG: septal ring lytic transglycosylase RlpA family protein [Bradyrhizobium sp.]
MLRAGLVGLILLSGASAAAAQSVALAEQPSPDPTEAAKTHSYSATGWASWYGREFHGRRTADGEVFDMGAITAAHRTMPLPCYARVTNLGNHRSILVRINDRGPYVGERLIDVSARVANLLEFQNAGLTKVRVDFVSMAPAQADDQAMLLASLATSSDDGVAAYAQTPAAKPEFAKSEALAAANRVADAGPARSLNLDAPAQSESAPPSPYGGLVASPYGDLAPWPVESAARPLLMAGMRF